MSTISACSPFERTSIADDCRRDDGMGMPGWMYTSEEVFRRDLDRVFGGSWLFAGHAADLPAAGDFRVVDIAGEQIILWRDARRTLRAHFNVCRHRGSRLTWEACGNAATLQCPYHQWTYRPDGRLAGARLMGERFRPFDYPLVPVAMENVEGLLFVCLSDRPPPFNAARNAIGPQLAPHQLERANVIHRRVYDVKANWKTLVENNRECYHCRVSHPEFSLSNYDLGLPGDPRLPAAYQRTLEAAVRRWHALGLSPAAVSFPDGEWFRVARMPLKDGFVTETVDGKLAAPLMGSLGSADVGSLRLVGLPNFWAHANADYASTTRLDPLEPNLTRVEVCFLVHADARPGVDFDVENVTTVLQRTFEQDIELCESVSAGQSSRGWRPGPLSPIVESSVEMFAAWYLRRVTDVK